MCIRDSVLTNQNYELLKLAGKSKTDTIGVTLTRTHTYAQGLGSRYILLEIKNVTSIPKAVLLDGQTIPVSFLTESPLKAKTAYYDLPNFQLSIPFDWDCNKTASVQIIRADLGILTSVVPSAQDALVVYPNPARDFGAVNLQIIAPTTDDYPIEVIDILGTLVYKHSLGNLTQYQQTHHSLPSTPQKGIFTVLLRNTKGEVTTQKMMIL